MNDSPKTPLTLAEQQALQVEIDRLYVEKLFTPVTRKKDLKTWLKLYLDADLTDTTIDENSTSNALQFVWSVYHSMLTGDVTKMQHVVAVARGGAKTLCAVIIEILAMLHFGRNVVHCAAEKQQSQTALDYFDGLITENTYLKDYIGKSNETVRQLINLPKTKYRKTSTCRIQVVVATKRGVNGKRAHLLVCDELDLVDPEVLSELGPVQVPYHGMPAIAVFLSSRQSVSGPIQKKIEQASNPANQITLHTWSMVDLLQKCPPEVHKPHLPMQDRYINNYTLSLLDEVDYAGLNPATQSEFTQLKLHEGCVTCPIAIVCRGRAVNQTSSNTYLRSIVDVKSLILQALNPATIISRYLNLKPESNGLVFSFFDRRRHFRPIEEVWEFAFGELPEKPVSKLSLCSALRESGWRIHNGVDFGLVDPATSVLMAYQKNMGKLIVINVENALDYDYDSWLEYVKTNVYDLYGFDGLFPDLAYTAVMRKARALHMPARDFVKPKVEPGVSFIRQKLLNPITQKSSFMIVADSKNDFIAREFESWTYAKTQSGYLLGQYEKDKDNHALDALRYACVPFTDGVGGSRTIAAVKQTEEFNRAVVPELAQQKREVDEQIRDHYRRLYGIDIAAVPVGVDGAKKGSAIKRKSRFIF